MEAVSTLNRPAGQVLVHAVDLILESAHRYSDELTLIAVGPLTNVARAVMKDPDRMRGLREIIIMGGAFETHGNVSPVAEFNIHADPHAAQIVCDSGIPLVFVPLDVTRQALLDAELINRYAEQEGARATFVRDCTARYVAFHRRNRGGQRMLSTRSPCRSRCDPGGSRNAGAGAGGRGNLRRPDHGHDRRRPSVTVRERTERQGLHRARRP